MVGARQEFCSENILDRIDTETLPGTTHTPEMASTPRNPRCVVVTDIACIQQGELLKNIAKLQKGVEGIRLAQDKQIKAIRDEIKHDTKTEIARSIG